MSDEEKVMPKSVRKGGKRFPMYSLGDALKWSAKLVSKTHNSPQPVDIIKASVVGAKSSTGDIRISVLKQFGLMEGPSSQYRATSLAKAINSAPDEELGPLLRQAALKPEIFKLLFATFHGDQISIAKLRQRAADLQVHPDHAEKCVEIYISSLAAAGLISVDGDTVSHANENGPEASPEGVELEENESVLLENSDVDLDIDEPAVQSSSVRRGVATVQVNISVDSSLDTEKLQKQLELLRKYGAI